MLKNLYAYKKQMLERAQILLEESLASIKDFASPTEDSISAFKEVVGARKSLNG